MSPVSAILKAKLQDFLLNKASKVKIVNSFPLSLLRFPLFTISYSLIFA